MTPPQTAIRAATVADAATILRLIRELAAYEREPDAVELTLPVLQAQLGAERPPFECVIAELDHEPVGFALFFPNYSTWRGCVGLHLEDLYVMPAARGCGLGKALLAHLAKLAVARGYARLEWSVLDWNTPAVEFYRGLGAEPLSEWTGYRLTGATLAQLAGTG